MYEQREVTNIIVCSKLVLKDGRVMGFTNNTEALLIEGVKYEPTTLLALSNIETTNNFSVDNLDVTGILQSTEIKEHDLLSGVYDGAEIEVFTLHYEDLTQKTSRRRGWIGDITIQNGQFTAEIRGLAQRLQCSVGEVYTPTCRAIFGDNRCKAKLSDYTFAGTVEQIIPATKRQVFKANMDKPDGYFCSGEVLWNSGNNVGLRMEIKEFTDQQFTLALAMPQPISVGDTFSAIAGCDKTFSTCCNKFKNSINYRGEPHVPGQNAILATPG